MIRKLSMGALYSFWDDQGDDDFRVGFFLGGNEDYALFALVTTRGYDDGLYLTLSENIYRADNSDAYTKRIGRLFELQGQVCRVFEIDAEDISVALLCQRAKELGDPISVMLDSGDTVCGFVKSVSEDAVQIGKLNEDGQDDGEAIVSWECIEKFRMDSGEERMRMLLRG